MAEIRAYFPAWRVYIFGVDVTEDVTRCTINYTGSKSRAPSTAEIELVNGGTRGQVGQNDDNSLQPRPTFNNDRYLITENDIVTLYGAENELPNIKLPDIKNVLEELNQPVQSSLSPGEPSTTLPSLAEALTILRPDLATGDAGTDELTALANLGGLTAAEFQREAARRVVRINRAREITEARTSNIIQTRQAQRQTDLERIVRERINASILDPVKRRVLNRKFNIRQQLTVQPNLVDPFNQQSVAPLDQLTGQALRYPFQVGDSIFHTNDQVRIFWRDPTTTDRWFHMFAGFVSDYTDIVDENDQRLVRFRIEDATRILRYARLTTNPGILDIDQVAVATDSITRTFFNDGFANLTLPEFLFTVVFGADRAGTLNQTGTNNVEGVRTFSNLRVGVNDSSTTSLLEDAVGSFNFERSFVAIFGPQDAEGEADRERGVLDNQFPAATIDTLGQYQALVDHQVYFSDLKNMSLPESSVQQRVTALQADVRKRADGTYINEDIVKVIGEHPELFPVDFGRLIFLVPGSLGPGTNQNLLLRDIIGVNTQTTWRTRLALIYDVMQRVDFCFYASPKGDILCEMPLYDFEPDDFGDSTIDIGEFVNQRGTLRYNVDTDRERGPFAPAYRVAKRDTQKWERSFIDENVRTQMVSIYSLIETFEGLGTSADIGQVAPVNLYGLMPQFGVRSELIEPRGIIANENAARVYANVKLNQINANAKQAKVEILPRVQLGFPNRPLEFEERTFVATTESITHSLVWGLQGDMTTNADVMYVRAWAGQTTGTGDDTRPVYEPIGGFASQALNYALRFGLRSTTLRNTREN